jgi:RHS repeat-associated protein
MSKQFISGLVLLFLVQILNGQSITVTLQPSGGAGTDANVQSNTGSTNYSSEGTIRFSRSSTGVKARSFLKFDLTSLQPGVDIISAKLTLYGVNHTLVNSGNGILQLVPDTWAENTITWNNAVLLKNPAQTTLSIASPTSATQNYTFNVLEMVQQMVNTPLINFGWLLAMENESTLNNKNYRFGSSDTSSGLRPKLEITYCNHLEIKAYASPSSAETATDAGAFLDITGGVPPYTFTWSNGATTKDIYNVTPGLYTVTVSDARAINIPKLIPITANCGNLSFTVNPTGSGFGNARLMSESFNSNTANKNYTYTSSSINARCIPSPAGNSINRSLVAFDLDALPSNIQVTDAKLILTDDEVPQSSTFTVQACRILEAWNSRTVTYNNPPDIDDTLANIVEFPYDGTASTYTMDVSAHMQKMIDGTNSSRGWMLKLKDDDTTIPDASSATFKDPALVIHLSMPVFACYDSLLNWNQEDVYDESGTILSSEKTYLDNLGRVTQKLVKNASGEVFRTEEVYDSYGEGALKTMPAYTGSQLRYQLGFIRNQLGQNYSYTDFDHSTTLNNPGAIQTGIINTLGYYYSDYNAYDAYQATTGNPYTRSKTTGGGAVTRVSQPGNAFKMGSGKETISFNCISGDELKYLFGMNGSNYYSYKASRKTSNVMDCDPLLTSIPLVTTKQVAITPDNIETISYSVGDKVIATAYCNLAVGNANTMSQVKNYMSYKGTKSVDIHLPNGDAGSLDLPFPVSNTWPPSNANHTRILYTLTDLYTDIKLILGTDYNWSGTQVVFTSAFLNKYPNKSLFLRISYRYSDTYQDTLDINSFGPTDAAVVYNLTYGRFSKNYYDLAGNLRKNVSPKGFDFFSPTTMNMVTTYDYSHLGQAIGVQSPDEGLVEMVYDKEGKLRYSQNAKQKLEDRFSYINYDKHGRPYETGENHLNLIRPGTLFMNYYGQATCVQCTTGYTGIYTSAIIDQMDGLATIEKSNVTLASYTVPNSSDNIPSSYSYQSQYQNFRNGQLTRIKSDNAIVWFNADKVGRRLASITQITEPDFVAKNGNIDDRIKTSESFVDYFTGLTAQSSYQLNNVHEYLRYYFSYDANLKPTITELMYGTYTGATNTLSTNSYDKSGRLKRVVIGKNYQGLDYVYTLNGGLKAINHPGLDPGLDRGGDSEDYSGTGSGVNKDLFGETMDFYYDDYIRGNTNVGNSISFANSKYDGQIYATRFKTRSQVNSTNTGADYINYPSTSTQLITSTNYFQQELRFEYTYDQFNQLGTSIFGTYNNSTGAFTQRSEYAETGFGGNDIAYDKNGNIIELTRQAYGGTILDDLNYSYGTNDNKLTSIIDGASNSFASSVNFKTPSTSSPSSFGYNTIGQLTVSAAEGIDSIYYFPDGKIKRIKFTNGNITAYAYGPMGEKLKSKCYNSSVNKYRYTWYVGPYVYEFDEAGSNAFYIKECNMPGGVIRGVSGTDISSGYLVYHLKDHLGNVRASFKKKTSSNTTGTGIEILSYNDYYAFGGQLPGRSYSSENYRLAFQGQEKSEDGTIWDQFDLRQYNHDLGRWFSPDPYGQFASPYLAMANNPVSTIDPDGGIATIVTAQNMESMRGRTKDLNDRAVGLGEYSSANVEKRYNNLLEDLRLKFLTGNYWDREPRNAKEFLDNIKELNNYFAGLNNGSLKLGYGTGFDFMSQTELGLNTGACSDVGLGAKGLNNGYERESFLTKNDQCYDRGNDMGICNLDNYTGRSYKSSFYGVGVNGKVQEYLRTVINADGSETHTYFDMNMKETEVFNYAGSQLNRGGAGAGGHENFSSLAQSGGGNNIIYQRTTETDQSTTGTFSIPGTKISGYILEPAGPSTTKSGLDKRIPAGTYNLIRNTGTKNGLRLYNDQVPKSRAILIHSGNYPGDTEGCLLPGSTIEPNFVGGSGPVINQIMIHFNQVGFDGATITILDINKP